MIAQPDRLILSRRQTIYFIMILLSKYIYNWIGNKYLQLATASPSPDKYSSSTNKTNQMTANVQAISIISKLSKSMSNKAYILNIVLIFNRKKGGGGG